ncbi:MAG TPA: hypothetical protein VI818_08840 [Candidatus Thermoplasmatota archaeon]|nr:hypothetical protein [Candidatus Thermoplasmatota archaeon]
MKLPRIDPKVTLAQPTARSLLSFLAKLEGPIRVRAAREALDLSIGQIGVAMRALERHDFVMRRTLLDDSVAPPAHHSFLEATDLGRELARGIQITSAPSDGRPFTGVPEPSA